MQLSFTKSSGQTQTLSNEQIDKFLVCPILCIWSAKGRWPILSQLHPTKCQGGERALGVVGVGRGGGSCVNWTQLVCAQHIKVSIRYDCNGQGKT